MDNFTHITLILISVLIWKIYRENDSDAIFIFSGALIATIISLILHVLL